MGFCVQPCGANKTELRHDRDVFEFELSNADIGQICALSFYASKSNERNFILQAILEETRKAAGNMGWWLVVAYARYIAITWLVIRLIDTSGQFYDAMNPDRLL